MELRFSGDVFTCVKARRGRDYIDLYDTEDQPVYGFHGIKDWSLYELIGGDFTPCDASTEEQIRADVDYLAIMIGVEL